MKNILHTLKWILLCSFITISCSKNPLSIDSENESTYENNLNANDQIYQGNDSIFQIIIEEIPDEENDEEITDIAKIARSKKNRIYSAKIYPKKVNIQSGEKVKLKVEWRVKIYNSTRGTISISDRLTGKTWSDSFRKLRGRSKGRKYRVKATFREKFYEDGKHVIDTRITLDTGKSDYDRNEAKIYVEGSNGNSDVSSGSEKSIIQLLEYSDEMFHYLSKAIEYAGKGKGYSSIISTAFNYAITIGNGLRNIQINRDTLAEEAYNQGWKDGFRDALRFKKNPGQGYIDIDTRSYYSRRGDIYRLAYDGGYAAGWRGVLE